VIKKLGRKIGKYTMRILIGLDQLGNTVLGGAPDETISARVGRNKETNPIAGVTAKVLDFIDPGHTDDAIRHERQGKHQDKAYEDVYDEEDYGFTLTKKDCE
jgi:hypothetical protein